MARVAKATTNEILVDQEMGPSVQSLPVANSHTHSWESDYGSLGIGLGKYDALRGKRSIEHYH